MAPAKKKQSRRPAGKRKRRSRGTRSSGRRRALLIAIGLPLVGLAALGLVYWHYLDTPIDSAAEQTVQVSIPAGVGFRGAVARLVDAGVVRQPTFFLAHAFFSGNARQLKAGTYTFELARTPREVLQQLVEGAPEPFLVLRVREGETYWDVCAAITALGLGEADTVLRVARDPELAARLGVPPVADDFPAWASPLEGFLFPDSYFLKLGTSPEAALERMVRRHNEVVEALLVRHGASAAELERTLRLSRRDLVTVASIVEAEVVVREEGATVAGVFYNRIRKGMKLQSDPTMTYHPDQRGTRARPELRHDRGNPFNTYAHAGLPPGPIGNPGRAALAAALAPARHELFYFVARQDGSGRHAFSRTYDEHKEAVRRYLK